MYHLYSTLLVVIDFNGKKLAVEPENKLIELIDSSERDTKCRLRQGLLFPNHFIHAEARQGLLSLNIENPRIQPDRLFIFEV